MKKSEINSGVDPYPDQITLSGNFTDSGATTSVTYAPSTISFQDLSWEDKVALLIDGGDFDQYPTDCNSLVDEILDMASTIIELGGKIYSHVGDNSRGGAMLVESTMWLLYHPFGMDQCNSDVRHLHEGNPLFTIPDSLLGKRQDTSTGWVNLGETAPDGTYLFMDYITSNPTPPPTNPTIPTNSETSGIFPPPTNTGGGGNGGGGTGDPVLPPDGSPNDGVTGDPTKGNGDPHIRTFFKQNYKI